jgi:nucleoredoxin
MAGVAKLFDGHILDKSNKEVNLNDEKYKGKVIGLYFSAHWYVFFYFIEFKFCCIRCPPCRRFTPVLIRFYKDHAEEKKFEIIFMSSDENEESFNEYYKDMPWLALDYKEKDKKEELSSKFGVTGIPTFILLDSDSGNIICTNARQQIETNDTKGENFPWKSQE